MKENREVTDTNVEDIEEALEKLSTGKKIKLNELLRTFKREGIENFVTTRKKYVDVILSDYKRALKENEELKADNYELNNRITDLLENIPIRKVKDRIEKYKELSDKFYVKFLESDRYNTDIREKGIKCDAIILALEELIEEREEKE